MSSHLLGQSSSSSNERSVTNIKNRDHLLCGCESWKIRLSKVVGSRNDEN